MPDLPPLRVLGETVGILAVGESEGDTVGFVEVLRVGETDVESDLLDLPRLRALEDTSWLVVGLTEGDTVGFVEVLAVGETDVESDLPDLTPRLRVL